MIYFSCAENVNKKVAKKQNCNFYFNVIEPDSVLFCELKPSEAIVHRYIPIEMQRQLMFIII